MTEDSELNDGTITQTVNLVIMGDNTFKRTGELAMGTDYRMTVPTGLVSKLEVVSAKKQFYLLLGRRNVMMPRILIFQN